MPPKVKFSKFEIINAAMNLVQRNGVESLTARSLGKELGCSSKPIFSQFKNMKELTQWIVVGSEEMYDDHFAKFQKKPKLELPVYVMIKYISFATLYPKLFQLLFMTEQVSSASFASIISTIDNNNERTINYLKVNYTLSDTEAKNIYFNLFLYSHGLASLIATNMLSFTEKNIEKLLTNYTNLQVARS